MDRFTKSILDLHPLPEADLQRLIDEGEEIEVPKGTVLVREGEVNSSLFLLKKGVLRGYRSDEERETTLWFVVTGEAAFSSWGYVQGTPARIAIVASTDSVVLRYDKSCAERLFGSTPDLAVWGRRVFEHLLLVTDLWLTELAQPLARERYMVLSEKMPEILRNVPLKDIAGYLGVTPQSLSRIRAELARGAKEER